MFKSRLFPVVHATAEFVPSRHFQAEPVLPEPPPRPVATTLERSRSPVWNSAASRRIRLVEGAVLLALMGYFGAGLATAIGLF